MTQSSLIGGIPTILTLSLITASVWATPPVLYGEPTHQSPLRADPDDLLLLPGYGLAPTNQVVYQALSNSTAPLIAPANVPSSSTSALGLADVVSGADAPYALAIHLPAVITKNQTYALWVWNGSAWSNGVRINDARPLWITPDSSYATAQLANLPRVLKVIGRNLEPSPAATATLVQLTGPTTYTLTAVVDSASTTGAVDPVVKPQIARYAAKVLLPSSMTVGTYSVKLSRDNGASWVALPGENDALPQTFSVINDPVLASNFPVSNYGCTPSSAPSATLVCVLKAIEAATQTAGGGTVVFGPGVWNIDLPTDFALQNCLYTPSGTTAPAVTCDGIILPPNVNLVGSVSATSTNPAVLSRGPIWATSGLPTFTLEGQNTVSSLYFADQVNYTPWQQPTYNNGTPPGAAFQLGVDFRRAPGGEGLGSHGGYNVFTPTPAVSHVTITENVFDKPWTAVANAGLPVDHFIVTDNLFGGAFQNAIYLQSNPNNLYLPYRFDDSIIAFNTFYPSGNFTYTNAVYNETSVLANTSGPVATQLNTALREDFSNNIADGRATSTKYFYNQTISTTNPSGWRAAFFWSTGNNEELTLVSQNKVFCCGDKAGDGEAIVFDGSAMLGGMIDLSGNAAAALRVIAASPWTDPATGAAGSTVAVQGSVVDPVISANVPSESATAFYPGQWLRILEGPGTGQWRKIISLTKGANTTGAYVAFNVSPALDVLPPTASLGSSIASISSVYWQNATIDNYVDQSTAGGCTKLNQNYKLQANGNVSTFPSGGAVSWFDSTSDSAMEGNQQQDTSGITLYHFFSPPDSATGSAYAIAKTSDEVRSNIVNNDYEWTSPYSSGGIQIVSGASATPADTNSWNPTNPTITAFALSIADNSITQAGASVFDLTPPTPFGAIGVSAGINENGPIDATGATAWKMTDATLIFHNTLTNIAGGGIARAAIGVASLSSTVPEVWRSVLYANACPAAQTPVIDYAVGTTDYCPSADTSSCECSGKASVDVGVTATTTSAAVAGGSRVTYSATITNNSSASAATNVKLAVEPTPGLAITSLAPGSGGTSCDLSVYLCSLGTLAPGKSVPVTITAVGSVSGNWYTALSTTHGEPDPTITNNGILVDTIVGPLNVDLSAAANVHGIFNDGTAVTNNGYDNHGTALSETLLGATVTAGPTTFVLGSAGVSDAVSNIVLTLPQGNFTTLMLLGSAVNGNHTNEAFVVTYTDGSTTTFTQSLSDWHTPQSYSGESTAVKMAYRLSSTGSEQQGPYYLYQYSFATNGAKQIKSLALPSNRDVVIAAITMVPM